MTASQPAFLDANILVYALDETSDYFAETVRLIQGLLDEGAPLCTSHHVIEEVLHVVQKLPHADITPLQVVEAISKLPSLILIEPSASLDFAERYAGLSETLHMGINDALLLQLMLDAGLNRLCTYDKAFGNKARAVQITVLPATP